MERIAIVNEQDEIIGAKERSALSPDDIYRVSVLWVTNSKGEILLAKRSQQKKKYPGRWSAAVGGTVEVGESYEENVIKETEEEIGLSVTSEDLQKGPKLRFKNEKSNLFSQWFSCVVDKPAQDFVVQKSEVESVQWFAPVTLKDLIANSPDMFSPSTLDGANLYLNTTQ